jgi:hypothetical protein
MSQAIFPLPDRRGRDRSPDPSCETCQPGSVRAIHRTGMAIYYRCFTCKRIWGEAKPLSNLAIRAAFTRRSNDRVSPKPLI